MRQEAHRRTTSEVSALEEIYRQHFQQDEPLPARFNQMEFAAPSFSDIDVLMNHRYTTYVTYGACEEPILAR
jgi:hypothetical protein